MELNKEELGAFWHALHMPQHAEESGQDQDRTMGEEGDAGFSGDEDMPARPGFTHYRRSKTNKAPRKRTFIANMEKHGPTDHLESAARGVGAGHNSGAGLHVAVDEAAPLDPGAGVAALGGGPFSWPPSLPFPTDHQSMAWNDNTHPLSALPQDLAALPSLAAPAQLGMKVAPPPPSSMSHAHSGLSHAPSMGLGGSASDAPKVSFDLFPELAALASGHMDSRSLLAPAASGSLGPGSHSRAVVTSVDTYTLPLAATVRNAPATMSGPAPPAPTNAPPPPPPQPGASGPAPGLQNDLGQAGSSMPPLQPKPASPTVPAHSQHSPQQASTAGGASCSPIVPTAQGAQAAGSQAVSLGALQQQHLAMLQALAAQTRAQMSTGCTSGGASASAAAVMQQLVRLVSAGSLQGMDAAALTAAAAVSAAATSNGLGSAGAKVSALQGQSSLVGAGAAVTTSSGGAAAETAAAAPTLGGKRRRKYMRTSSAGTGAAGTAAASAAAATTSSSAATNTVLMGGSLSAGSGLGSKGTGPATAAAAAALKGAGATGGSTTVGPDGHPTAIALHGMSEAGAVVPGSAGTIRISRVVSIGGYGVVYRGMWGGRGVAVKLMRTPGPNESLTPRDVLASFRHEADVLRRLAHPNIVAVQHAQDVAPVCIVQDFAAHGTLSGYIHAGAGSGGASLAASIASSGRGFPAGFADLERAVLQRLARRLAVPLDALISNLEMAGMSSRSGTPGGVAAGSLRRYVVLLCLLRDVALGLAYLAAPPPSTRLPAVVHRDVKPANILLTAQGVAMLADFGLCHVLPERPAAVDPRSALLPATSLQVPPTDAGGGLEARAMSDMFQAWRAEQVDSEGPAAKRARVLVTPAAGAEPTLPAPLQLPASVDILPSVGDMDLTWLTGWLDDAEPDAVGNGLMGGTATVIPDVPIAAPPPAPSGPRPASTPASPAVSSPAHSAAQSAEHSAASASSSSGSIRGSLMGVPPASLPVPTPSAAVAQPPGPTMARVSSAGGVPTNAVNNNKLATAGSVPGVLPPGVMRHGTAHYAAPEDLAPGVYPLTPAADVYSWACCAWEALAGARPWAHTNASGVAAVVGAQGGRLPLPDAWPERMRNVLAACWAADPASRPPAAHLAMELDAEIRVALHG